jgi:hypothetical protein
MIRYINICAAFKTLYTKNYHVKKAASKYTTSTPVKIIFNGSIMVLVLYGAKVANRNKRFHFPRDQHVDMAYSLDLIMQ